MAPKMLSKSPVMKKNNLILRQRPKLSLGDLIMVVSSCAKSPKETVATVADLLASGKVRIDGPGFVHALQLLQRCQPFRGDADAFQKGEAVFALVPVSALEQIQRSAKLHGRLGITRIPGSHKVFDYNTGQLVAIPTGNFVPYVGAMSLLGVVPEASAQSEAAFALLEYLSGPETSRDIVVEPAWGGGVYRRDHLEIGWQALGLDTPKTGQLVDILRATYLHTLNPVERLRIPEEREHQKALLKEVRAALLQGKDAGQALTDAAKAWAALDAKTEPKTRILEYRLSLGLQR